MDEEPCSAKKTGTAPVDTEAPRVQEGKASEAKKEEQKPEAASSRNAGPSNGESPTPQPETQSKEDNSSTTQGGTEKTSADQPEGTKSVEDTFQELCTRISSFRFNPQMPLPPLLPEDERVIIKVLDLYLKDYRNQTLEILDQVRNSEKRFSDKAKELKCPTDKAHGDCIDLKNELLKTKEELTGRDRKVEGLIKCAEGLCLISAHSLEFETDYENVVNRLFTQKLVRAAPGRTIDHIVKKIDDTLAAHEKDIAEDKREWRGWYAGSLATSVIGIATGLAQHEYLLSGFSATQLLVVIKMRPPKRPKEKSDKKNGAEMNSCN